MAGGRGLAFAVPFIFLILILPSLPASQPSPPFFAWTVHHRRGEGGGRRGLLAEGDGGCPCGEAGVQNNGSDTSGIGNASRSISCLPCTTAPPAQPPDDLCKECIGGPGVASVLPSTGPCLGGVRLNLTLAGSDAGIVSLGGEEQIAVTVGGRACAGVAWAANGSVLSCTLPPGVGRGLPVSLRVGAGCVCDRSGDVSFSYNPPLVSSIRAPTGGVPTGGGTVTLLGVNFGGHVATPSVKFTPDASVSFLQNIQGVVSTSNDSSIVAGVPAGVGAGWGIRVSVGGQDGGVVACTSESSSGAGSLEGGSEELGQPAENSSTKNDTNSSMESDAGSGGNNETNSSRRILWPESAGGKQAWFSSRRETIMGSGRRNSTTSGSNGNSNGTADSSDDNSTADSGNQNIVDDSTDSGEGKNQSNINLTAGGSISGAKTLLGCQVPRMSYTRPSIQSAYPNIIPFDEPRMITISEFHVPKICNPMPETVGKPPNAVHKGRKMMRAMSPEAQKATR